MTPEQRDMIAKFEAFTQADASTTRTFGGTGLGLRISNALALQLGGRLEVDSTPGEGSEFSVTIETGPLDGVAMVEPEMIPTLAAERLPAGSEPSKVAEQGHPLSGTRILLAEDGPVNQRLISLILERAGAEVTVAENGRIAAEAIENASPEELPHMVLMDMQMPELDGYGATRRLRERGFTLPIIALTAHAMDGDRQRCLDTGCDDYLTKPIDPAKLIVTCVDWRCRQGALES